jgi:two-component system, OmpR family, phosphate regulon sensor histidine kinase PhoR
VTASSGLPDGSAAGSRNAADTVSRRIGRVIFWVAVVCLAVGVAAAITLWRSAREVDRLSGGYGPASDANAAALTYMLDAETGIRGYALTGAPAALAPYRHAVRNILPAIDTVRTTLHDVDDDSVDADIMAERRLAATWIDTVARRAVVDVAAARQQTEAASARRSFDAFRRANAAVAADINATRARLRADTHDLSQWEFPLIVAVVLVALLGSGYAVLRTTRSVSRPLTALSSVVRRLEGGDLTARADESAGPVEVRTVAAAVNDLAGERARGLSQEQADERLRLDVRGLTSAIRIGQDAQTIARTLVAGLGRVFDADLVWLVTFADQRVPRIGERWRRSGPAEEASESVLLGAGSSSESSELLLQGLANRLWHGAAAVGIPDHRADDPSAGRADVLVPEQLTGARASMIAAVGEGNAAFGLLWVATTTPRAWTAVERGLLQHVAGELAQNLVQNHVLAQQRVAMRRLRQADEAKSALVSTVSHELRTPLTSIMGYLDVLFDGYGDQLDPDVASMLRVVERNATRLKAMIEDLLQQSRLEAGRRIDEPDQIDLAQVLGDVRETVTPLAANGQVELEMRPPSPGSLIVSGDERELTQALTNLAANAVKFTRPGGRITISAGRDGAEAEIRVSDTGIGIAEEDLPHLFERFFRAGNARSEQIPGTGLGLAIVADIVARHGGSIDVQSTLGIGTSFDIRLPLAVG